MATNEPLLLKTRKVDAVVVAALLEIGGGKRLCIVRRDGSCSWRLENGQEHRWREGDIHLNGPVLSAAWRPFSTKRSVLALGFSDYVVFCDAPGSSTSENAFRERRVSIPQPAHVLTWSPKGRVLFLASMGSNVVLTLDAAFGAVDGSFRPVGFRNSIRSFAWSSGSNSRLFVSGGIAPVFKVFAESMQSSDTWACSQPVVFGGWSRDGNRFLCGNAADGITIVDLSLKAQWVILSSSALRRVVEEECREEGDSMDKADMEVRQLYWDPVRGDTVVVVLGGMAPKLALLFKCTKLDKIMSCTFMRRVSSPTSYPPIAVDFDSSGSSSRAAVLYADGGIEVIPDLASWRLLKM